MQTTRGYKTELDLNNAQITACKLLEEQQPVHRTNGASLDGSVNTSVNELFPPHSSSAAFHHMNNPFIIKPIIV